MVDTLKNSLVGAIIDEHIEAARRLSGDLLVEAAAFMAAKVAAGGSIFLCGNGGSAAETQHFTTELLGRFMLERPGIPAIALTTDVPVISSLANDYSFEEIFSRQLEALMRPGDVLLALSTSGRSANVLRAISAARAKGGHSVLMCGPRDPSLPDLDIALTMPSADIHRIQELHLLCGHILCRLMEDILFGDVGVPARR